MLILSFFLFLQKSYIQPFLPHSFRIPLILYILTPFHLTTLNYSHFPSFSFLFLHFFILTLFFLSSLILSSCPSQSSPSFHPFCPQSFIPPNPYNRITFLQPFSYSLISSSHPHCFPSLTSFVPHLLHLISLLSSLLTSPDHLPSSSSFLPLSTLAFQTPHFSSFSSLFLSSYPLFPRCFLIESLPRSVLPFFPSCHSFRPPILSFLSSSHSFLPRSFHLPPLSSFDHWNEIMVVIFVVVAVCGCNR